MWKEKCNQVSIIAFESLPWACKISEIGKDATIFGHKEILIGGPIQISITKDVTEDTVAILQRCIG